jgi:hypothetical protein
VENGAFSEAEFAEFGKQLILFCHITSQVESDPYQSLLQDKGGMGFPYIVFMDETGNVLAQHRGLRTVAGLQKTLDTDVKAYADLLKKASGNDEAAKVELFLKRIELGHFPPAEGRKQLAAIKGLSREQAAKAQGQLATAEFTAIASKIRTRDEIPAAGKSLLAMKQAGHVPAGREALNFWFFILTYAESEKDVKLYEECLGELKKTAGDDARSKAMLEQLEKKLAELKEKAGAGK